MKNSTYTLKAITLVALCGSLVAQAQILTNASFEAPIAGDPDNFIATPVGSGWNYTGDCGVANNYSSFTSGYIHQYPDGAQTAYMTATGTISQTVTIAQTGTYEFRLYAGQAPNFPALSSQEVLVLMDTNTILDLFPLGDSFFPFSTNLTLTAGSHTLTFQSLSSSTDDILLIDNIEFQPVPSLTITQTNSEVSIAIEGGLTNRVYQLAARHALTSSDTTVGPLNANSSTNLTAQPADQNFYLLNGASDTY
jgi:hypothetical protein